jgi:hypothetical protein
MLRMRKTWTRAELISFLGTPASDSLTRGLLAQSDHAQKWILWSCPGPVADLGEITQRLEAALLARRQKTARHDLRATQDEPTNIGDCCVAFESRRRGEEERWSLLHVCSRHSWMIR